MKNETKMNQLENNLTVQGENSLDQERRRQYHLTVYK